MRTSKKTMVFFVLLGCMVMALVDGVFQPAYAVKSMIKLLFFFLIPGLYLWKTGSLPLKKMLLPQKRGLLPCLLLGAAVYGLILGAYLAIRKFYDFSAILPQLSQGPGVTRENFLFVAIYISLCNSLLEEFFFRGFAFLSMLPLLGRRSASLFSAFLFAVYHIAIMGAGFPSLCSCWPCWA